MIRFRTNVLSLAAVLIGTAPRPVAGQAPPTGPQRFWVELGLGGSRQEPHCDRCFQQSAMGGPSATIAAGVTVAPGFGVGLFGRQFSEFSFDYSHTGGYYGVLAQITPPAVRPLVFNLGLGQGEQHGDPPPNGDNGRGTIVLGGLALRLPSGSRFGFTLNVDWIKQLTGSVRTAAGQPSSDYHPSLFTVGIGLNIATPGSAAP